jgi:hypothetical protein
MLPSGTSISPSEFIFFSSWTGELFCRFRVSVGTDEPDVKVHPHWSVAFVRMLWKSMEKVHCTCRTIVESDEFQEVGHFPVHFEFSCSATINPASFATHHSFARCMLADANAEWPFPQRLLEIRLALALYGDLVISSAQQERQYAGEIRVIRWRLSAPCRDAVHPSVLETRRRAINVWLRRFGCFRWNSISNTMRQTHSKFAWKTATSRRKTDNGQEPLPLAFDIYQSKLWIPWERSPHVSARKRVYYATVITNCLVSLGFVRACSRLLGYLSRSLNRVGLVLFLVNGGDGREEWPILFTSGWFWAANPQLAKWAN